jgi:GTP cyclohydrolase II
MEHVAMVKGEVEGLEGVPVRIHSECLTSEVFGIGDEDAEAKAG